jgi:uncharacterized protein YgbK (DUF1537 family)
MDKILLGCIADDFTGGTDLANNLVRSGMRTVQTVGVPKNFELSGVDAVVVALKSRTIEPKDAISQSLEALKWLKSQGAKQIYFKYCSTFDSTAKGNIGPVTEALMKELGTDFTVVTPAFPDNGRTIFKGHLFVGDLLLSDSSMRHHPLTPMTESNLVKVMQSQYPGKVGLIDYKVIQKGESAISSKVQALKEDGVSAAVVDSLSNEDLMVLGRAVKDLALVTAGSGLAIGLAQNFGLEPNESTIKLPSVVGFKAILSGSCSEMTLKQVNHFQKLGFPCFQIDPIKLSTNSDHIDEAIKWARDQFSSSSGPILIYSTSNPQQVASIQNKLSVQVAGEMVENAMAQLAKELVTLGVGQLLVAGGETSGKCVQSLNISHLQIGPQIDPGVPWCYAYTKHVEGSVTRGKPLVGLHVALKSGNFGSEDFFSSAWKLIEN